LYGAREPKWTIPLRRIDWYEAGYRAVAGGRFLMESAGVPKDNYLSSFQVGAPFRAITRSKHTQ